MNGFNAMDDDPILAGYTPAPSRRGAPVRPVDEEFHANLAQAEEERLRLQPARLLSPTAIRPREWLYGRYLIRKFMTLIVAEGGVGKSAWATMMAMEMAAGRTVLGYPVHAQANAALFNLEDPLDEMERGVAAAMLHHNFDPEELSGRLYLNSGRDRRLIMGSITPDGAAIAFPDRGQLIAEARRCNLGVIVVDPFVRSHELTENDNNHMAQAASAWCEVAAEANLAVVLVHHRRKGSDPDEGIDAARGGKALSDAARVGVVISRMTPEEAEKSGVEPRQRWRYIRVDDAKTNLAPPAERANWMRLVGIKLGNGTADYPEGDEVRTLEAWTPASPFEGLSDVALNAALDVIDEGAGEGELFTASRRGGAKRWAGKVLVDRLGVTEDSAKVILATWLKTGLLYEEEYRSKRNGREATGVKVDGGKRPGTVPQ